MRLDHRRERSFQQMPLLRWAGSKRGLVPILAEYWRDNPTYIEPFAGSACLFFHLQPSQAVLGDLNPELIEVYRILRKQPKELYAAVVSLESGEDAYYRVREMRPNGLTALGRAARFIYLNRHCFNGIFRTNGSGKFNVPYGGARAGVIPTVESFIDCGRDLKGTKLVASDFEKTLRHAMPGDFVYLDPPYYEDKTRIFREYGAIPFGRKDLGRLIDLVRELDSNHVSFVLSYTSCSLIKRLCRGWKVRELDVRRSIAGFAHNRGYVREVMITNVEGQT